MGENLRLLLLAQTLRNEPNNAALLMLVGNAEAAVQAIQLLRPAE
jgi:hypothetical protein